MSEKSTEQKAQEFLYACRDVLVTSQQAVENFRELATITQGVHDWCVEARLLRDNRRPDTRAPQNEGGK